MLGDADKLAALRQLRLRDCDLLLDYNYSEAVVNGPGLAALSKLPTGLEHLSISRTLYKGGDKPEFPTGVLARLQQLTYLELSDLDLTLVLGLNSEEDCRVQEEGAAQVHTLQPLQVSLLDFLLRSIYNIYCQNKMGFVCFIDIHVV